MTEFDSTLELEDEDRDLIIEALECLINREVGREGGVPKARRAGMLLAKLGVTVTLGPGIDSDGRPA